MPEDNTYIKLACPNCQTPLTNSAQYCSQCGQKKSPKKLSLYQLFSDFLSNVFNLDGRIWQTFISLFIPGKLTLEYFRGRHRSYYNPIRFFLVTSLILFTMFSFKGQDFLELNLVESSLWKDTEREIYYEEFHLEMDSIIGQLKTEINSLEANNILDSLAWRIPKQVKYDSVSIGVINSNVSVSTEADTLGSDLSLNLREIKISQKDMVRMNGEELIEHYNIEGFWRRLFIRQFSKTARNTSSFASFIWSNLPAMLLLMMPSIALFFKLLYFRRNRYFVEHLVFVFHIHAYIFLLYTAYLLLNIDKDYFWVFLVLITNYLFFSLKNYYEQGYLKTFAKLLILSSSYLIILLVVFMFTISAGLFMF